MIKIYVKEISLSKKRIVIEKHIDKITENDVTISEWDGRKTDLESIKNLKNVNVEMYMNGKFDRMEVIEKVCLNPGQKVLTIAFK